MVIFKSQKEILAPSGNSGVAPFRSFDCFDQRVCYSTFYLYPFLSFGTNKYV